MADDAPRNRHRAVPASRIGRLGNFAGMAGSIAGGMIGEGARRLAAGERPTVDQLLLTPANAKRLTDRLAHLRGAAMKLGQMVSLDAGDLLSPELSAILARLRENADYMPPRQLDKVLAAEWGTDWRKRFRRFEPRPIAAASIGQVHRAMQPDGRMLAIKVQYPGVAQSIESDVDNVAGLLRLTGLLPAELDIAPLLAAAKAQLREEADYLREGAMMQRFAALLADQPHFIVPALVEDLTTPSILAMSYEDGGPIEKLEEEPQDIRDRTFAHLIDLVGRELFETRLMQTDPNFANYRWQAKTARIVLLDFGATREVSEDLSQHYRQLLEAGIAGDRAAVLDRAVQAGFVAPQAVERHPDAIQRAVDIVVTKMTNEALLDFADRSFVPEIRDTVVPIAQDRQSWHLPPAEMLFVQRKVSGTALLGARLKARVDVRGIVEAILARTA